MVQEDESFAAYLVDYINYKLFLCYKLFFNAHYIKHSYAFLIILIIFVITLIFDFIFCCYSLEKLKTFMLKQSPSYNKLYKDIFTETRKSSEDLMNPKVNEEVIANPLRKELGNKYKKIDKRSKTFKKFNPKKLSFVNRKTDNTEKDNINIDIKKEGTPKEKKLKKRKSQKYIEESKEKLPENENKEKKEEVDLNELPYTKALELDKRNIFLIFYSFLVEKLEFISVFCSSSRLTIMLLVEYILSLLINFFLNALLYSDDIVSHKYHNNGKLDFAVSLVLSIISNIVTSILCYYLRYSRGIDERIDLLLEIKMDLHYLKNIKKFYVYLKRKFVCFFISKILVFAVCLYYIEIFCVKYYCSQISLLINYSYSFIESVITSFAITLIILFTRKIGLSCHSKEIYNTSKFINSKT
jgi:hypothetical protein